MIRSICSAALIVAVVQVVGCSEKQQHPPGRSLRDSDNQGIFGRYMDGKFDSAGHPYGAKVWQAEVACKAAATGEVQAEGWGARPGSQTAGVLCDITAKDVGPGPFTINLRLLSQVTQDYSCPQPDLGVPPSDAATDQGAPLESAGADIISDLGPTPDVDVGADAQVADAVVTDAQVADTVVADAVVADAVVADAVVVDAVVADAGAPASVDAAQPAVAPCPPAPEAITVSVFDDKGKLLGAKTMRHDRFRQQMTYQNLWVNFVAQRKGAIRVEVRWHGARPVRVDYLELFRSMRRVVIEPPSYPHLDAPRPFRVELIDGRRPLELELSCDGQSLDAALKQQLTDGQATSSSTDFRRLFISSTSPLLDACQRPARLKATMIADGWSRATARVTYRDAPIPCAFEGDEQGKTRVLITGFEPFPADTSWDNSSERAVSGFDASGLKGAAVMRVVVPVEWDSAAALVTDLIQRCQPQVVIGFGQGRYRVDLESTAYNSKDSSDVSGGVPDNRGLVFDGAPVAAGAPAELRSTLPLPQIVAALNDAGENARESDDPGRYICNNIFYAVMHQTEGTGISAGFVHLPTIYSVGDAARARLQQVLETVIQQTLEARALAAPKSATKGKK